MNSALVTWEATYLDGTIMRERDGKRYHQLVRSQISSFRLVVPGEILVETPMQDGRSGHNLVYRRRNIQQEGLGWVTWFLVGFVPMGPVIAIQPETEQTLKAAHFQGRAGPLGMVQPLPEEKWLSSHSSDAHLMHQTITLPSGYVLNWR